MAAPCSHHVGEEAETGVVTTEPEVDKNLQTHI